MTSVIIVEKDKLMVDFIQDLLARDGFSSDYVRLTESNPKISVARIQKVIRNLNHPLVITCMFYEKFDDGLKLIRKCHEQADFIVHTTYAEENWVKKAAKELSFKAVIKVDEKGLLAAVRFFDKKLSLHRLGVPT